MQNETARRHRALYTVAREADRCRDLSAVERTEISGGSAIRSPGDCLSDAGN